MSSIGVLVSVVLFVLNPASAVSVRVLVPIAVAVLVVVLTLWEAGTGLQKRRAQLPRVVRVFPPTPLYADSKALLLLEESDLFSHDSMVSVFSKAKDFEQLIGLGFVATIQDDGLIQVCVLDAPDESTRRVWDRILQNNKDELGQLLVKPSIPRSING